jgi:GT2 family glycosyltransferase
MDGARLTVVIPSSGRWAVLERTLDALAAQTVTGFSIILIVNDPTGQVPPALRRRPRLIIETKVDEGPGVARNRGLELADSELVLFLGDDTIPTSDLVHGHLRRHAAEPQPELAVLGRVRWHPEVAANRLNRWLDWSGSQFDYAALDAQVAVPGSLDAGFGRFYSSNVSLKRAFAEPFDPAFRFGYEDIDLGWRLAQRGMVLRYEPRSVALHLHANTLEGLARRFDLVGEAEATMAAKHAWFEPWFLPRFIAAGTGTSPLWPAIQDRIPPRLERLWWPVHTRAQRWYWQALAPSFLAGWRRGGGDDLLGARRR